MTTENIFELVFLAIIAGALIFRLRSVLGTRPDNDIKPSTPAVSVPLQEADAALEKEGFLEAQPVNAKHLEEEIEKLPEEDSLKAGLNQIKSRFPHFSLGDFVSGAKVAFEMITSAFAKGEIQDIKPLVSSNIFLSYKNTIEKRNKDGHTVEFEIIRFVDAQLKDASLEQDRYAKLQVDFTTEQVNVVKDGEGKVVQGSDSFINKVHDLWCFTKDLTSPDPNWVLVSTKGG